MYIDIYNVEEANQQNDFSFTFHYSFNKKNKVNEKKIFKTLVANLWSINKSQDEENYTLLLRTLNDFKETNLSSSAMITLNFQQFLQVFFP